VLKGTDREAVLDLMAMTEGGGTGGAQERQ